MADLERTLGEFIGKLEYIKPIMENFDRISRTLAEEQSSMKKENEITREELKGVQDKLGTGVERFHQQDMKIAECPSKRELYKIVQEQNTKIASCVPKADLDEKLKTSKDRWWQFFMLVLSAILGAVLYAWANRVFEAAPKG